MWEVFCPSCSATLPVPKFTDTHQVCALCGHRMSLEQPQSGSKANDAQERAQPDSENYREEVLLGEELARNPANAAIILFRHAGDSVTLSDTREERKTFWGTKFVPRDKTVAVTISPGLKKGALVTYEALSANDSLYAKSAAKRRGR